MKKKEEEHFWCYSIYCKEKHLTMNFQNLKKCHFLSFDVCYL